MRDIGLDRAELLDQLRIELFVSGIVEEADSGSTNRDRSLIFLIGAESDGEEKGGQRETENEEPIDDEPEGADLMEGSECAEEACGEESGGEGAEEGVEVVLGVVLEEVAVVVAGFGEGGPGEGVATFGAAGGG